MGAIFFFFWGGGLESEDITKIAFGTIDAAFKILS